MGIMFPIDPPWWVWMSSVLLHLHLHLPLVENSDAVFSHLGEFSRAKVKWCVNNSGGDLLPLRDG